MGGARVVSAFESADQSVVARLYEGALATYYRIPVSAIAMKSWAAWQRRELGPAQQVVSVSLVTRPANMEEEVRRVAADYMREFQPRLRAVATVIAARGFVASALRAITTTFLLVSRAGFPNRVFGDLDSAGKFLAEHADDRDALAASVEFLRSFVDDGGA